MTKKPEHERWFAKADADERSIVTLLKDKKSPPETIAFLAQQVAEKYLKGFLTFHKKEYPNTHHIELLIDHSAKIYPELKGLAREAETLSELYIESRYPTKDDEEITREHAQKAFAITTRIKKIVLQQTQK